MSRVFNFSAGPAVLPEPVLERARAELSDWHGHGMSVMEMSHRGRDFTAIAEQAEADLRRLLGVPDDYAVLFVQGGASQQFAMVPLNLLPEGGSADYLDTGTWSDKAIEEGARFGRINVVASSRDTRYTTIPAREGWRLDPQAAYVHYTPNETIVGVEFPDVPEVGDRPLVADMSSTILSRPIDVRRFGLIYAGAQKNIGPAGLTVVIVRRELLGRARAQCPTMLDYAVFAKHGSMYNTPPTFGWYLAGLIFEWLLAQGGLPAMAEKNARKAGRLYAYLDGSGFYRNPVDPACRSWMNVPFRLADESLDAVFLKEAEAAGLVGLAGHRIVGGMRASLYNAMPEAGVEALIAFLQDFVQRRG
ncbi:MAG TPA: 3-phosphoserine/phosphohydroxythreonine transaminase [Plasticicumulans sp.]|uniref:3-phosphoserine/phosphohydroxythreonine transaminase n=1 Tax=Plasticicumulans sp. TaxID=2307179 RepID=UPI002C3B714C|nr:3-phosphoserine/phosphohydroxythreonine transaminase [Plasticicumulans sp.]HMW30249.1 3-phosphoserine/phosphohydroxythreonine transaminase [Plasticicumulans sp.]HMX52722.1 3-phosphoserine/phosphohydroxythreonine transaminase [Plasticicumulans sp.]HNB89037.1 3-phosphoserine/phosphohydroxythreonine transaminase [Plasticicumulans sp.]HNK31025.1 3-phosphoserine/phosphohydroxythreonine transaminase [Plasticicumulans sp.]HNM42504.1 3-phosphoserine/phosphohydroxythreonine transaminase [Plasticicum